MKIGIDISQLAYSGTGVATYTQNLVENLLNLDRENEYILFFSSLRKQLDESSNFQLPRPPDLVSTRSRTGRQGGAEGGPTSNLKSFR
ncbi:MAG: hypothetical protein Q8N98_01070, partial [bacterium]|nr:hypothetical protein [bacterium]